VEEITREIVEIVIKPSNMSHKFDAFTTISTISQLFPPLTTDFTFRFRRLYFNFISCRNLMEIYTSQIMKTAASQNIKFSR